MIGANPADYIALAFMAFVLGMVAGASVATFVRLSSTARERPRPSRHELDAEVRAYFRGEIEIFDLSDYGLVRLAEIGSQSPRARAPREH